MRNKISTTWVVLCLLLLLTLLAGVDSCEASRGATKSIEVVTAKNSHNLGKHLEEAFKGALREFLRNLIFGTDVAPVGVGRQSKIWYNCTRFGMMVDALEEEVSKDWILYFIHLDMQEAVEQGCITNKWGRLKELFEEWDKRVEELKSSQRYNSPTDTDLVDTTQVDSTQADTSGKSD
ncbi:MAG: hypothetical protein AMJ73_05010 [candidate division Zixibacteria bacterium SM1_73]|nr:MAG: hypothetical protein AMJ73_05010 [candidate division Zixibacteria bacterium SM1_73]